MNTPDLLRSLEDIKQEAERALQGLASGSIPRGNTALTNIKYRAGDALAEAHEQGRIDYDAESARVP